MDHMTWPLHFWS